MVPIQNHSPISSKLEKGALSSPAESRIEFFSWETVNFGRAILDIRVRENEG
jgi:hypothetical protein